MNKLITALLLSLGITSAYAASATSCAATYTIAAAEFARVGENKNADAAVHYTIITKNLSLNKEWGGNSGPATSMYKQALSVAQSSFRMGGWAELSRELGECQKVLALYGIK